VGGVELVGRGGAGAARPAPLFDQAGERIRS
jgi:hypothetical protein